MGLVPNRHVSIMRSTFCSGPLIFDEDRVVHANFLRSCHVLEVSVEQIDRNETDETELWVAYPINKEARRSWMSQYFDEACKLSTIARDISRIFLPDQEPGVDIYEHKRVLYDKLRQWEQGLPEGFAPAERPATHIILLRFAPPIEASLNRPKG